MSGTRDHINRAYDSVKCELTHPQNSRDKTVLKDVGQSRIKRYEFTRDSVSPAILGVSNSCTVTFC